MTKRGKKDVGGAASRMEQLMRARELTIRELSKRAKVPRSTVGSWLAGANPTDYLAVKRVAHVLGTTLSYLLTGEADNGANHVDEIVKGREVVFEGLAEVRLVRLITKSDP